MKPITDLHFICPVQMPMKKTAIADQLLAFAGNNRKLRRQTSLVPGEEFLQHSLRLPVRVWADRKTHEIAVCHYFRECLDVFALEGPQN